MHNLVNETREKIFESCLKLEKFLTYKDSKDIDANKLCSELQAVARKVSLNSKPLDVLNYIYDYNLPEVLPNVVVALRIFLTLPVSVATAERSFSKLKLIKTYLRSTISEDRLVGLATLSIEHEIAQSIEMNEIISSFSKQKARKIGIVL